MKEEFTKQDIVNAITETRELFVNYEVQPNFRIFEQFTEKELNRLTETALNTICSLSHFVACMNTYRTDPRFRK